MSDKNRPDGPALPWEQVTERPVAHSPKAGQEGTVGDPASYGQAEADLPPVSQLPVFQPAKNGPARPSVSQRAAQRGPTPGVKPLAEPLPAANEPAKPASPSPELPVRPAVVHPDGEAGRVPRAAARRPPEPLVSEPPPPRRTAGPGQPALGPRRVTIQQATRRAEASASGWDKDGPGTGERAVARPIRHATSQLPTLRRKPKRRHKRWIIPLVVVVGLLAGAYVLAGWYYADKTPANATAGGIDVGGLSRDVAVAKLTEALEAMASQPVTVTVGDQTSQLDPLTAGLSFDPAATIDKLVGLSFNPGKLWAHFQGEAAVDLVINVADQELEAAVARLATETDTRPVEAQLSVASGSVVTTLPEAGQTLDQEGAVSFVEDNWLVTEPPWNLDQLATPLLPTIGQAQLDQAISQIAEPLLSAPVMVSIESVTVELPTTVLSSAAQIRPKDGQLVLSFNQEMLVNSVSAGLDSEVLTLAQDARFVISDGKPVIEDGTAGKSVDGQVLVDAVAKAAVSLNQREAQVQLAEVDPATGRAELEALGVKEVVGRFETIAPANPTRTKNLIKAAEIVSGMLVKPGETFSLDTALGHRSLENGWTSAGVVIGGKMEEGVGGGLSQFSTTLFNAAFLAGMEDVAHTPHSNWFSRYPKGREATLWEGQIDNIFKNTTPYGVVLNAGVTSSNVVWVELWSTEYWQVEDGFGEPYNFTSPRTIEDPSDDCKPQAAGGQGFSIEYWRKLSLKGELVEEQTWQHTYAPINAYECLKDKPEEPADQPED